jgi:hypothetical protein
MWPGGECHEVRLLVAVEAVHRTSFVAPKLGLFDHLQNLDLLNLAIGLGIDVWSKPLSSFAVGS